MQQTTQPKLTLEDLKRIPHRAIHVLHVLAQCENYSATYYGIQCALATDLLNARRSVRAGVEAGIFLATQTGKGRGAKTVVTLTSKAHELRKLLFG